ncbi:MAG: AarF/UbiB family protein [Beijerinckiaceae bacterium]
MTDREANRFSARAARYAKVGANVGGVAARFAAQQLTGGRTSGRDASNAAVLAQALGGLKGPLMKVAQLMATIPDLLPPEYADELAKLQSDAPPMGAAFVKRRMQAELGAGWEKRFKSFDLKPAAAASLGQVHRAVSHDGEALACKLQYPDMKSAVEADLKQLDVLFAIHRRFNPIIDTTEAAKEIGARVREELDYQREAKNAALYEHILGREEMVRVPRMHPELSTERLLTMQWLDGEKLLSFKSEPQEVRNRLGIAMFKAWWLPFSRFGVIHGDPHLGNYSVFGKAEGVNLLDYGCVRIFPPKFVGGVVDLYEGLRTEDQARIVHAYEMWGFKGLKKDVIETLNVWARFIYGPILEDRVRTVADGVEPGRYGRREAFQVHQALKDKGPVTVPREFVFLDRAAVGLGAVFLHLGAELNYHRMFNEALGDFHLDGLATNQTGALTQAGLA